jgi:predicted transposase/invertase (TIGR01784 family)
MTITNFQKAKVIERGGTYGGRFGEQRPNPKNDFLFKKLFSQEKSKPQLISLLNAILCRNGQVPIADVTIRSGEALAFNQSSIDLICETERHEMVNVEMQIYRYNRQPLNECKRAVAIHILDYDYLPVEYFHSKFQMYENWERDFLPADVLEVHFLECRKFLQVPFDLKDPLHRWLRFLDQRTTPEQLKELMEKDAHMKSAEAMLYELLDDPEVRESYWQRRMAEHERATWQAEMECARKAVEEARAVGRAEGLAQGRAEAREEGRSEVRAEALEEGELKVKEIALNMLDANMDIALIEEFTGLKASQIVELRKKL